LLQSFAKSNLHSTISPEFSPSDQSNNGNRKKANGQSKKRGDSRDSNGKSAFGHWDILRKKHDTCHPWNYKEQQSLPEKSNPIAGLKN